MEDYKNSLEATQLENKINHLEKKPNVESLRKNEEEFIKDNQLISILQRIFRNKKHNVSTNKRLTRLH